MGRDTSLFFFCILFTIITSMNFIIIINRLFQNKAALFTIRHCKDDYDVKEDFIGVFPCAGGVTSKALFKYVKDMLVGCNMDPQKMVGMSFDEDSSIKNLAKLIKENVAQQTLYVHCFAHANELVFKDAKALSPMIAYAQDFCEDLYALVGVYPNEFYSLKAYKKIWKVRSRF